MVNLTPAGFELQLQLELQLVRTGELPTACAFFGHELAAVLLNELDVPLSEHIAGIVCNPPTIDTYREAALVRRDINYLFSEFAHEVSFYRRELFMHTPFRDTGDRLFQQLVTQFADTLESTLDRKVWLHAYWH